jgi:hypothetical protein
MKTLVGRIVEQGEAHFKYIWAESSTQRRLALLALAVTGMVDHMIGPT